MAEFLREPEFWILIAAALCIAVIWKPAKRSIVGALDARAERIRAELAEARGLVEEARRTLAEYQGKARDGALEARKILAQATAEAERLAHEAARELDQLLARRRQLAEERIAQAEANALGEIRAAVVDLAVAAARAIIAAELDEARGARLIDAAISQLPRQLH